MCVCVYEYCEDVNTNGSEARACLRRQDCSHGALRVEIVYIYIHVCVCMCVRVCVCVCVCIYMYSYLMKTDGSEARACRLRQDCSHGVLVTKILKISTRQ